MLGTISCYLDFLRRLCLKVIPAITELTLLCVSMSLERFQL